MSALKHSDCNRKAIIFDSRKDNTKKNFYNVGLSELHDVYVTPDFYVFDHDGVYASSINERVTDKLWRDNRTALEPLISKTESEPHLYYDEVVFKNISRECMILEGCYYVYDYSWGSNYQHWLLVSVERLFLFPLLKQRIPDLKLLVNEDVGGFKSEMFELLGIHNSDLVTVDKCVKCETLLLPSFSNKPGDYVEKKSLVQFQALKSHYDIVKDKFIYVARNDVGKRPMKNREELDNLLASYNYQKVFLEDMTLKEKIELFSTAEIIVGDFSAGLSHMVFSSINQKFILIEHDYFKFGEFYGGIAKNLQLEFLHVDSKLPLLVRLQILLKKLLPFFTLDDEFLNTRQWSCNIESIKSVLTSLHKGSY